MPIPYTDERILEPWKIRLVIACVAVGGLTSLILLGFLTWAVFSIWKDHAGLPRIRATVISVRQLRYFVGSKYAKYELTVQYKTADGRGATNSFEETTFGFPRPGDSITVIAGPYGTIEANPLPEVVLIVGLVYAGFGWILWLVMKYVIPTIRTRKVKTKLIVP